MIRPGEIQQVARKSSVRDTQIEKDLPDFDLVVREMNKHLRKL